MGKNTEPQVVDERTGETADTSAFVDNLRAMEREIRRLDDTIAELRADVKASREAREKLVSRLRSSIREGTVLPLFEVADSSSATEAEAALHDSIAAIGDPDGSGEMRVTMRMNGGEEHEIDAAAHRKKARRLRGEAAPEARA